MKQPYIEVIARHVRITYTQMGRPDHQALASQQSKYLAQQNRRLNDFLRKNPDTEKLASAFNLMQKEASKKIIWSAFFASFFQVLYDEVSKHPDPISKIEEIIHFVHRSNLIPPNVFDTLTKPLRDNIFQIKQQKAE